ncbi:DUF6946 family protein [Alteribacter keqinensis]|uniref:DUF6946 domain-containing protein n=1 Tax=Alteribacter keqinensis TaxID=2483800 RepID=A0A3M7TZ21_9BACI|nr:hypothetical protein [Alteribacter keqinensis]RNA70024.1 hypothetical protein EBO34_08860 [Alteribacter keqinensis]
MSTFFNPAGETESWSSRLADKKKQWVKGRSAMELAESWESARGFPMRIEEAFKRSGEPLFKEVTFLYGFPEYKVPLRGGATGWQNDLYVLAKAKDELITIMVEGKVDEPFGPVVSSWYGADPGDGKKERLKFLLETLGLEGMDVADKRYQLLHRTASAVIEAKRIGAKHALMLVHSFSETGKGYKDYEAFLDLFPVIAEKDSISGPAAIDEVDLYFGWVTDEL